MAESDKAELHIRFFNAERVLYSAMDIAQRQSHRAELALMIFEARARMNAIDDVDREEKAKLSKDGKDWIVTNSEVSVSNAINEPKIRKERMSKADKLKESMASLGLDMSQINSIMGDVARVQSGGSVVTDHNRVIKESGVKFVRSVNPANNTQESLLGDVTKSLIDGLQTRPIEDLVDAAKTAGHIGNKLLGPVIEKESESVSESVKQEIVEELKAEEEKPFDVSKLFG